VQAGNGLIWISRSDGVYWVDPAHVYKNPTPPPVMIEAIYEGDQRFSAFGSSRLSKLPQNVRIEYTALSLSIPERVRFRYQLEGYDKGWQDVGTRRAAYYPKLPPGHFRFHVIAANNDGVWNQTGAVAEIVVPPAFYQTAWSEALCAFAGLALLWGLYRYRVHQIAQEFNMRLEVRVSERNRLARDLHDTLLQSFHGLMLHFQVVSRLLPEGRAKEELETTLERADVAIAEGRSAVYDLRSSATATNDLAEALNAVGSELSNDNAAVFNLMVEGQTRELHPIIRDEIYRLSREALSNAFRHAHAHHIEAEISYGSHAFRLRIRDDGEGIPTEVLDQGRAGHFGLPGMRERAKQIGAELTIWSRPGTGTEIDLSLAGTIAYGTSPRRSRFRLFRKKEV
jgi:signal transduction histidine kinase